MIKNVGNSILKILIILISLTITQSVEALPKLKCPDVLRDISGRNFTKIFTVKNPIPNKGNLKLFPDSLLTPGLDGKLPRPTKRQVTEIMEKVLDYATNLYKWHFITKSEYDDYIFNIQALAQLPFEAGNPYFPENSNESYQKPAGDVVVDDSIAIIDGSWNTTDKKIRRSPDIKVLHPRWRMAGLAAKKSAQTLFYLIILSIGFAVIPSISEAIKGPASSETVRLSYEQLARATLSNFKAAPSKVRDNLKDFYRRKHGMFGWIEVESRDEYVQAQQVLMQKQLSLKSAIELDSPKLVKNYIYDLIEFEEMFQDIFDDPIGERLKITLTELYNIFDPGGKIRAEYKTEKEAKAK